MVGHVTIEAGVAGVLGLVDDAGVGIDHQRFVREAAHVGQRRRVAAARRNVEAPAMAVVSGLFAGEPRAPRRDAAGTVADRSRQARPRRQELALSGVEQQVGRTATAGGDAFGRVGDVGTVADEGSAGRALMIANQHNLAVARPPALPVAAVAIVAEQLRLPLAYAFALVGVIRVVVEPPFVDDGHAIVQVRADDAVGHRVAGPAVRPVAEACGELQELEARGFVLPGADRPVRADAVDDHRAAMAGSCRQFLERQRPHGARAHRPTTQKRPAIRIDEVAHSSLLPRAVWATGKSAAPA